MGPGTPALRFHGVTGMARKQRETIPCLFGVNLFFGPNRWKNLMDRSTARSLIYNTLSLCYVYPDEKVYASIAMSGWIRGFRKALHLLDEKIFENCLRAIEQAIPGAKEDEQLAMAQEYTRLFINAFPHVIAPPYGSIYLEKEGLVLVETTSEVLHFYHEVGFILKEDLRDRPDHVANELEFMAFLAGKESQASGNEKITLEEVQMNFLCQFILQWVPTFCDKVAEHSRYPFYYHLGNLTKEFINFEKNYLGIPEELNSRKENESETMGG
jgi:TorA maturation chaperone TorD